MMPFHTILHPSDFSPYSAVAFRMACKLAEASDATLLLLAVNEAPQIVYGELFPVPEELAAERKALKARLDQLEPAGVRVERHLIDGIAAEEIVRFAAEHGCDLIVMGTHGRTGLGRLFLGSVAEQVVRKAPCPVLTMNPHVVEPAPVKEAVQFATSE